MPPKKPDLLPGPKRDSPGSIKHQEVKTANRETQKKEDPFDAQKMKSPNMETQKKEDPFDAQKMKTANRETQKKEDPFDEEFDKFVCSIEKEINDLEEKHKNL